MHVPWKPAKGYAPPLRVLCPRPGRRYLLCGLGDESSTRVVTVHWDEKERRTVPHLAGRCPWCPRKPFDVAYAPVAVYGKELPLNGSFPAEAVISASKQFSCWQTRVLNITAVIWDISQIDLRNKTFVIYRAGDKNNSPLRREWIDLPGLVLPEFQAFDVRPHLERMWGLELLRQVEKQERLKFMNEEEAPE